MPEATPPGALVTTLAAGVAAVVLRRRPPFALCYHGVAPVSANGDPHGLVIAPEVFAAQLDALLEGGYRLVTMSELWAAIDAGGARGAGGLGAITFDDGLAATLERAAGVLAERGARATAFVPSALLGAPHPDLPEDRIVDGAQLRELASAGFEIGGHSATHVDLAATGRDAVREEVRRSRAVLEDVLGERVAGMAYPFGSYTPAVTAETEAAGYRYACGCGGSGPWRRYAIPREAVYPTTTTARMRLKVNGAYGPLQRLASAPRRRRRVAAARSSG